MWSHLEVPRELRHICDVIFLTEILTAATRSCPAFATIYLIYGKDYQVTMRGMQGLFLVTVTLWLVIAGEAKRKTKREDYVTMMSDEDSNYDEENENDEYFEPCQCGVFLSQQVGIKEGRRGRPRGPPQGEPVVTYDTDSPSLPCGTGGFKNCISRCLDVILKYLPRAGPVICGAVERDVHREKAFLFIRNCGGDWTPTSFSAGKEFCCTDGEHHKC